MRSFCPRLTRPPRAAPFFVFTRRYKDLEEIADMLGESPEGYTEKVKAAAAAADSSGTARTAEAPSGTPEVHVEPLVSPEPEVGCLAR